jgi:tripartite-type tricarboxylate transporter receptor subunit TctC
MQGVFRRLCAVLSACVCLLAASAGFAQDYPNRRITLLVGFAAGSGADILARYYASELASETGQVVVVENKPGANGIIAARA